MFNFTFEPYKGASSKKVCPSCGKKTFNRFVDMEGILVHETVGYCDRLAKCGYSYHPMRYYKDHPSAIVTNGFDLMDSTLIGKTMKQYYNNNFVIALKKIFPSDLVDKAVSDYKIGTSKKWDGATLFWFIDSLGRARTAKSMLYDTTTLRRVKSKESSYIRYEHPRDNFKMRMCLFGEHLLNQTTKAIGIVESEKSAVIASIAYPDRTWLATAGMGNIKSIRFLEHRDVVVYADWGAEKQWQKALSEIWKQFPVRVVPNKNNIKGYDVADYILEERMASMIIKPDVKNIINDLLDI